jgi:hypothetical protein
MKLEQLNTILAQELGRNPYGAPVFCWKWSNDLFWPTAETGRMVKREIVVPLIGQPGKTDKTTILEKEFKPRPMTVLHRNCFIVCRWLPPAALVGLRLDIKIGDEPDEVDIPRELIVSRWQKMFPGADYPERGWYVTTDYFCGQYQKPTYDDNQFLIRQLRHQLSDMSLQTRYLDMCAADDENRAKIRSQIEDECEDSFTAFLNPYPGRRGSFVSYGGVEEKTLIKGA